MKGKLKTVFSNQKTVLAGVILFFVGSVTYFLYALGFIGMPALGGAGGDAAVGLPTPTEMQVLTTPGVNGLKTFNDAMKKKPTVKPTIKITSPTPTKKPSTPTSTTAPTATTAPTTAPTNTPGPTNTPVPPTEAPTIAPTNTPAPSSTPEPT